MTSTIACSSKSITTLLFVPNRGVVDFFFVKGGWCPSPCYACAVGCSGLVPSGFAAGFLPSTPPHIPLITIF